LHQNSTCHLNLKSSNILLTDQNTIKISDFGISSLIFNDLATRKVIRPDVYSPEMLLNEIQDIKDLKATDTFSFGILLYEIICREYPYPGQSNAQIIQKVNIFILFYA
jgi:serine/threonine protein kinase